MIQLELLNPRNRVPAATEHTGKIVNGFRIVTASDLPCAYNAIAFARITGSVGDACYHHGEAGEIVRWAIVERVEVAAP